MMNANEMMNLVAMMSKLNENDLKTLMETVSAMNDSGKKSAGVKTTPVESKEFNLAPMIGKIKYNDDAVTVTKTDDKQWRLYIHVPSYWGRKKGRSPQEAKAARDKIKYAIKTHAKQNFGAKFTGNYDTRDFHWTFPDKDTAKAYIKDRQSYNNK